jgi:hypothetical protein
MTVAIEKEKETTEQKISKSSGNATQKYSEQLEKESEDIINQMYHPDKVKEQEEVAKKTEAEAEAKKIPVEDPAEKKKPEEKKDPAEETITAGQDDTLETLKEKLKKSEERRSNTQSEFSKRETAERSKDSVFNATIEALKDTIASLKNTTATTTDTAKQEAAKEKDIKANLGELDAQFKTLENIDPDIAKPIKALFEGMAGQITGLQTQLKTTTEAFSKSTASNEEEAHFGKIESAHKGYEALMDTEPFKDFIEALPNYIKRVAKYDIEEGSAESIIELLDTYKETIKDPEAIKKLEKEKKIKLAEGLINPGSDDAKNFKKDDAIPVKYTRKSLRAMLPEEYKEKEADIDYHASIGNIPDQ